jgi:hypothetical protein
MEQGELGMILSIVETARRCRLCRSIRISDVLDRQGEVWERR